MGRNSHGTHNAAGMAQSGQHHMTMTDPIPGGPPREKHFGMGYFSTLPGMLKIIQLVISKLLSCLNISSFFQTTF